MSETTAPFTRSGLSWTSVGKLLAVLVPFAASAVLLYLGKEFATHPEVKAAVAPYENLPAQVMSLQEFRSRQERAQEKDEAKFEVVQSSLATISAQQRGTDEKLNRVLDTLERMQRRAATP